MFIDKIYLDIKRTSIRTRRCCYPSCNEEQNLQTIPLDVRYGIAISLKIYINRLARVCYRHMKFAAWVNVVDDMLDDAQLFTASQIEDMFDLLTNLKAINSKPAILRKILFFFFK